MLTFLTSPDAAADDYFYGARILLAEENAAGAVGFIINRLFPRRLNGLQEFAHLPPFPLYEGGPVDGEHLYFIHKHPQLVEGGQGISDGWWLGGNFAQAVQAIAQGTLTEDGIRIFLGYCGWEAGDIESEGWERVAGSFG